MKEIEFIHLYGIGSCIQARARQRVDRTSRRIVPALLASLKKYIFPWFRPLR